MMARGAFAERARQVGVTAAWLALFAATGILLAWFFIQINPLPRTSAWYQALGAVGLALGFLGATWLVGVVLGRRPWDHWGWPRDAGGYSACARGVGVGLLLAALAVGLAFVTSRATVRLTGDWSRYLDVAAPLAVLLLAAALVEELVFRGYPMRRLAEALTPRIAVAVLAVGFAAAHAVNPAVSAIGLVNIALAGVWLSLAFFSPGGMPLAWGLHFGWNAGLALVFDAPVSGQRLLVPAIEYEPGRHAWVDGGPFGPEGGVVGTIALIAGIGAVLGGRFTRPREWLV